MKIFFLKYVFLTTFFTNFISCENDVDNRIPENATKLEEVHQDFKQTLLKNTIKTNNKVWVSKKLNFISLIRYFRLPSHKPNFFVAFDFNEDNTVNTYVTIGHEYGQTSQSKSVLGSVLFDNPNIYRVGGELRTELTFLSKSILSDLKRIGALDFDFRITEFSDNEIKLKPYFTQSQNPEITLVPCNFDSFKIFAEICQFMFSDIYSPGGRSRYLCNDNIGGDVKVKITIVEKSKGEIVSEEIFDGLCQILSIITQDFNEDEGAFYFRFVDLSESQIAHIGNRGTYDEFYIRGIKYLSPISISKSDDFPVIVFDSYGENGKDSKKYEVTIRKP